MQESKGIFSELSVYTHFLFAIIIIIIIINRRNNIVYTKYIVRINTKEKQNT